MMFGYMQLEESEFINLDSFTDFMESEGKLDIVSFEVVELGQTSELLRAYEVQYFISDNSRTQKERITLAKTGEKRFLFFDDYRVQAGDTIVANYRLQIPKNAAATLDGVELASSIKTARITVLAFILYQRFSRGGMI